MHTKKPGAKALTLALAAGLGLSLTADTYRVLDDRSVDLTNGDIVAAAETTSVSDTFPDVGLTPVFRFDCLQTNKWTITANREVKKIPSQDGSRYLFSEKGYMHDIGARSWDVNDYWQVQIPLLAHDETLDADILDFGAQGSCKAMLFDKNGSTVNGITNIGTVVAVYNSAEGGGTILGGGYGGKDGSTGNHWVRGDPMTVWPSRKAAYMFANNSDVRSAIFWNLDGQYGYGQFVPASKGLVRMDSADVVPTTTGFNGGWQVVSVVPTNSFGVANGLGLGVVRQNISLLSGGMKIAEMVIFTERLDVFSVAKIEDYMAKKWLNRTRPGCDGVVRVGTVSASAPAGRTGVTNVFQVAAGEKMTVSRPTFGRGIGARLVKTGAGEITFGNLRDYAGALELNGGTMKIAPKAIPTEFPRKPLVHLDPSVIDSMTTAYDSDHDVTNVTRIASQSDDVFRGHTICAMQSGTELPPYLRWGLFNDVNGAKAPVLDFHDIVGTGSGVTWGKTGGMLRFARADSETFAENTLENVSTLVAVISPRGKGGHILGASGAASPSSTSATKCYFDRNQDGSHGSYTDPILGHKPITTVHSTLTPTNGILMIDGEVVAPLSGYPTTGFIVLAIRVPGSIVKFLGTSWSAHWAGGFMMGEMAIWNTPLSEDEMRDASAYLANKWMHRTLSGYRADADVPEIAHVDVTADSSLNVAAGETLRVGALTASAPLTLTGGGTLKVVSGATVSAIDEPAADPALDLDACDLKATSSTVSSWNDKYLRLTAAPAANANAPSYLANATPSGLPAVGFGNFRSNKSMNFPTAFNSVRSAYVVAAANGSAYFGGMLLGASGEKNVSYCDLPYGTDRNGWPNGPFLRDPSNGDYKNAVGCGEGVQRYTNGVEVTEGCLYPTDGSYRLYEIHFPAGAHVSGLCVRGTISSGKYEQYLYSGGMNIGEVMLYERELSEQEKVATRNYLLKKWFGETELAPLPENEPAPCTIKGLAGNGTLEAEAMTLAEGAELTARSTDAGIEVDGTLTVGANLKVTVEGYQAGITEYVVARAEEVEGLQNLRSATITGIPDDKKFRLRVLDDGDTKVLKVVPARGFIVVFR